MALHVDEYGKLYANGVYMGVRVTRGAEFTRNWEEYTDSVPGVPGEYLFGVEQKPSLWNLPCFRETSPEDWDAQETALISAISPRLGVQPLTFANRSGKVYNVIYIGQLPFPEAGPYYREFTLPFKMHDPRIKAAVESTLVGSGTAVNAGNEDAPLTITIVGAVTNPSVSVGGKVITYAGTLTASDTLVIDTGRLTATYNGVNAMAGITGLKPGMKLAPGNTTLVAASAGTTTFSWLNCWS